MHYSTLQGVYLCLDTQRSFRLIQQVRVTGLSHPGSLCTVTPVECSHMDDEQLTEPASYTELSLKSIGPFSFCVCGLSAPAEKLQTSNNVLVYRAPCHIQEVSPASCYSTAVYLVLLIELFVCCCCFTELTLFLTLSLFLQLFPQSLNRVFWLL